MDKLKSESGVRMPVVAGRFYPGTKKDLVAEIDELRINALKYTNSTIADTEKIRALLVPHAGYVFSGTVAASAFQQLRSVKQCFKRVFLIGSSHHSLFNGASVFAGSAYSSPLGTIRVDTELCEELIQSNSLFNYHREAHEHEHSLEVQLPFLQTFLNYEYKIVPILLGGQSEVTPREIAKILDPYFNDDNLFIISTDLSHYPEYNEAVQLDTLTINAFCQNNPEAFLNQLKLNEQRHIPHLSTSMCGWTAALTLLYLTKSRNGLKFRPLLYQNSGDIPVVGDKKRVVGYQALAVIENTEDERNCLSFNESEQKFLLDIAKKAIYDTIGTHKIRKKEDEDIPRAVLRPLGAFVSVYIGEELRGCIGRLESEKTLVQTIFDMAISASSSDSRFQKINKKELEKLKIEISVLSPLKRIYDPSEIIPGKHGILIRKDYRSGTFLPQVAKRTGWSAIKLLEECSVRKAGLGRQGWRDAKLYCYEAFVFSGN